MTITWADARPQIGKKKKKNNRRILFFQFFSILFVPHPRVTKAQRRCRSQQGGNKKAKSLQELLQVLLRADTGTGVEAKLHVADLLVNLLHKLKNEIYKLVLVHLLGVEVGEQEADVITLQKYYFIISKKGQKRKISEERWRD